MSNNFVVQKENLVIIENTKEAKGAFGRAYECGDAFITSEQLEAVRQGKVLALYDGEYVTFISLETEQDRLSEAKRLEMLRVFYTPYEGQ